MIDPGIDIETKFKQFQLPCDQEHRMNNAFNAPVKSKPSFSTGNKKKYESDSENE